MKVSGRILTVLGIVIGIVIVFFSGIGISYMLQYEANQDGSKDPFAKLAKAYPDVKNLQSGTGIPVFTDDYKLFAIIGSEAMELPVTSLGRDGNKFTYRNDKDTYYIKPTPLALIVLNNTVADTPILQSLTALDALKKSQQTTTKVPLTTTWKPQAVVPPTDNNTQEVLPQEKSPWLQIGTQAHADSVRMSRRRAAIEAMNRRSNTN